MAGRQGVVAVVSILAPLHESGHVVAALAVGGTVDRAVGGRHIDGWTLGRGLRTPEDELVFTVGGWVADSLAQFPDRDHPMDRFPWGYGSGDAESAWDISRRANLTMTQMRHAVDRAERILRQNWTAVRRIEAALEARGEISGQEIQRLWQSR
jgi:hypothetical protein